MTGLMPVPWAIAVVVLGLVMAAALSRAHTSHPAIDDKAFFARPLPTANGHSRSGSASGTVPARALWGLVILVSAVSTGAAYLQMQAIRSTLASGGAIALYLSVSRSVLPVFILIAARFIASGAASPRLLILGAGCVVIAAVAGILFAPDLELYAIVMSYTLVSIAAFAAMVLLFRTDNVRPWPVGGIMFVQGGALSYAIEPALRDTGVTDADPAGSGLIMLAIVVAQFVVGGALAAPLLRRDTRWSDAARWSPASSTLALLGAAALAGAAGVALHMTMAQLAAEELSSSTLALIYSFSSYTILIAAALLGRSSRAPVPIAAMLLAATALLVVTVFAGGSEVTLLAFMGMIAAHYVLLLGFLQRADGAWSIGLYLGVASVGGTLGSLSSGAGSADVGMGLTALLCGLAAALAWRGTVSGSMTGD